MPLKGEFTLAPKDASNSSQNVAIPQARPIQKQIKTNRSGIFSTYVEYPEGITFQNQEENEQVVLLLRKDFITNFPWILFASFLIVIPFFVPYIHAAFLPFIHFTSQLTGVILIFYFLVIFGFILLSYATWYFQVGLVTNIRLVDINVPNLLTREVSETFLDLVKDVSYTQNGVIRSFFEFGDVSVQTDAPTVTIIFDAVPRPGTVAKIITNLVQGQQGP